MCSEHRLFTERENGQRAEMALGELLHLQLPEIAGTAYVWQLADQLNFEIVGDHFESGLPGCPAPGCPAPGSPAPGAIGSRLLQISPRRRGELKLLLNRHPSWETPDCADAHFTLYLRIR